MEVWVVYDDMGYDGNSVPYKAFSNENAAAEYCETQNSQALATDNFCEWEKLEVENYPVDGN